MMNKNSQSTTENLEKALGDVECIAEIYSCSTRHVIRMVEAGKVPAPVRVGNLVRWRLRTGDPMTGVYDHIDAGCPNCHRSKSK
ncbi:helix-turn-helix transcriptional regulator [Bythopirellula polymerisocia]|uniref:Helix-turn-helix domain protein n=1 Tax=Bythopirellula polymerisocia TaxID=2528003 RepID=A0A5C6CC37_9BACT|nr:helix-turn-helix domain-containing protein [Bythopirellula polymerisocia]TWU21808.1 hypothetical protein Pla144_45040 [Bythopirellula polymerisocia]